MSMGDWTIFLENYLDGNASTSQMPMRSDNFENSLKTKAMNSPKSALPKNPDSSPSFDDPIIKEVRDTRHALASELGNDLQKIVRDLIVRQAQLGQRLRSAEPR